MQIDYVTQAPPGRIPWTLDYQADGDVLTVTLRTYRQRRVYHPSEIDPDTGEAPIGVASEQADTFDFTGLPDGALDVASIETDLPVQPIVAAERVDGELRVTVLDWGVR